MSSGARTTRRLFAVAALALSIVSCSSSSTASSKARPAYGVEVDPGGPYEATVGTPVKLAGRVSFEGERDVVDDLTAIGQALLRYRDAHGSYPPAALTDGSGKALLSWRVLLLPELGLGDLFSAFDLSKPWDDPANKKLLSQMPAVYGPASSGVGTEAGYAAVAGARSLFQRSGPTVTSGVRPDEVLDGADMTIAVGPVGRDVHLPWTAPGDVDASQQRAFGSSTGFSGRGPGVTPMLFADGRVHTIVNSAGAAPIASWSVIDEGGCTAITSYEASVDAAWDVDGTSKYSLIGDRTTFTPSKAGSVTIRLRGVDSSGKPVVRSTRVVVR